MTLAAESMLPEPAKALHQLPLVVLLLVAAML
jgi:hypothetical protein